MNFGILNENIRIAIRSIKANLLRAILTMFIIAFGIMALVGILTAIESIKSTLTTQFSTMGASAFAIKKKETNMHRGGHRERTVNTANITYDQATEFVERFQFPATVAISGYVSGASTIKFQSQKTDPNIEIWGVDEYDMLTSGKSIGQGRNFSHEEIEYGKHVIIVGSDVVKKLFKKNENPINQTISVGNGKYRIVGVLAQQGTSFNGSDRLCLIPITNARQYYPNPDQTYRINIMPAKPELLDVAISEAEGIFRIVRRLAPHDANDFEIESSNSLANMLINNLRLVTMAATIIGIITLFGAAIGLMNIMLVSVTERTSEIGIRKALGAKTTTIKQQFLLESVIIGQMGGALGIILGILIGNMVAMLTSGTFIIPWVWILLGVLLCFVVGVIS
ncbi:MAG TPA: ABC transporter permease, partial [Bacteroidales bacterium]